MWKIYIVMLPLYSLLLQLWKPAISFRNTFMMFLNPNSRNIFIFLNVQTILLGKWLWSTMRRKMYSHNIQDTNLSKWQTAKIICWYVIKTGFKLKKFSNLPLFKLFGLSHGFLVQLREHFIPWNHLAFAHCFTGGL